MSKNALNWTLSVGKSMLEMSRLIESIIVSSSVSRFVSYSYIVNSALANLMATSSVTDRPSPPFYSALSHSYLIVRGLTSVISGRVTVLAALAGAALLAAAADALAPVDYL